MKTALKYLFFALTGFFALVGLLVSALAIYGGCQLAQRGLWGTRCYLGWEGAGSTLLASLPLPEQTEQNLPMVVEKDGIPDSSGLIIFRAPASWQEAFCALYTLGGSDFIGTENARKLANEVEDKSILHFINSREWQFFHSGRLRPGADWFFSAMRDNSGEYVLLYLYSI